MKAYQALDLFDLDSEFSPEEKMIRETVRNFVTKKVIPIIGDAYDQGIFPKSLVSEMGDLGLLGSSIAGYGCPGLSATTYGIICQELERGDSGLRSFVSVQSSLCMFPIWKYASEDLKQKYLPKMATGEWIGCFGLTEPDFGSNPAGMLTTAKKSGDHYVLNGTKMWITNGGICSLAIVWAKNEVGKIIGLVVDRDLPGFGVRNIEKKFSLRASVTSELNFQNCRVPATHLLQVEGLRGPFSCLHQARFGITWGVIGSAMACLDEALHYSKTRIQFDRPLAGFQLIQAKLTNMATEITKAQWLTYRLARLKDQGKDQPHQVSMCKMNNVAMALQVARTCRDILGASGITYEYQVGRHLLNLESVSTYEGTDDIHRLIVGEKLTGLSAFK